MTRLGLPAILSLILLGGCIKGLPEAGDGGASGSNGSAGKATGAGGASGAGAGAAGAAVGAAGSDSGQAGAVGGDSGAGTSGGGSGGAGTGGNSGGAAGASGGGGAGGNGGASTAGHGGVGGGGASGHTDGGAGSGSAGSDGGVADVASGGSDGAAGACSWTLGAPTMAAHGGEATAVLNGQLYLAAGFGSQTTEVYDPVAKKWSTKAQFPANRCYPSGAAIGGKIYVAGGCDSCDCRIGTTGDLEEYDPAGDSWASRAPMPTPRSSAAAGVIGGKLIVAGGTGPCPPCTPLSTVEAYDPTNNSWTPLKSMPTARRNLSGGAVVGGKLYVIGGFVGIGTNTATDVVEAYDPGMDSWATLPPLPRPLYEVGAQSFRGQVLAIGGDDPSTSMLTTAVNILNPTGGSWTPTVPILQVPYGATCGEIGGVVYCVGAGVGVGAGAGIVASTALQVFTCQ